MRAASERNYSYSPDPQGSLGIGSTADHFAFTYQIPSWTFELEPLSGAQDYGGLAGHGHSGFILPAREVARMRTDVVRMYLLGFYRQSGPPVALAAQIRDVQTNEIVFDARWSAASTTTRTQTVTANRALVPGRNYRLWAAFNKPMRVRDAAGAVAPYRGQSTGASIGNVSLQSSLTPTPIALGAEGIWLNTPGGAPDGYSRYADDAFALDFSVPSTLAVTGATPTVLRLTIQDLAGVILDANPATAVDWESGHWVRYESDNSVEGDVGGTDCSFKPFVAATVDAPAPSGAASCVAPIPPPNDVVTPAPARSGGGGALGGAWLLALLTLRRRRRCAKDAN